MGVHCFTEREREVGKYGIEINNHKMTNLMANFPKFAVWGTLFQTEREREREKGEREKGEREVREI